MRAKHIIWTYIKILIVIGIIVAMAIGVTKFLKQGYEDESYETVKTDMLLIQAKIKIVSEKKAMKEKGAKYIGIPIIEMAEDEKIKALIEEGVINPAGKNSKYYILKNEHLNELELSDIKLDNEYYVVDYKTDEVIYTKGTINSNGKLVYKLSDIETKKEEK